MTPKITSKPISEGIKIFHGLKLAFAGGVWPGNGTTNCGAAGVEIGGAMGLVNLRPTKVSSSSISLLNTGGGASTRG